MKVVLRGARTDYQDMTDDQRDAAAVALVLVDDDGVVEEGNPAAASLLHVPRDALAGRRFFGDLAPGTNVPRGYGRFLARMRGRQVPVEGRFAFDGETHAVRADLAMSDGGRPGTHWIAMTPVPAPPSPEGVAVVRRRSHSEPVDASACEREPIHIPGSVQPDAVLLVADADLRIVAHSDNLDLAYGAGRATLVGAALDEALPADFARRIRDGIDAGCLGEGEAVSDTLDLPDGPVLAVCHAHAGRILVELEPVPERPGDFGRRRRVGVEVSVSRLRHAPTLAVAVETAAREVRAYTGFDAVLVYRFDPDWNGEAIAEDKAADWQRSLLGLHFPASDIPAQARALYLRSKIRFVTDRDAAPVPILGDPALAGSPVDLTYARHRSLSPIHLEYQRNLGVNGSMSASIIVDGALWGLLIGHCRRPLYVPPDARAAAALVADALAMRVQEIENRRVWEAQQAHLAAEGRLVRQLTRTDDFVAALTAHDTTMLDLFDAGGAAVVTGDEVTCLGTTPDPDGVRALRDWLLVSHPRGEAGYVTQSLSAAFPPAAAYAERASGMIAVFVDEARDHLLMWFKPEVRGTVNWGGDPNKPVAPGNGAMAVLPRRSFERWSQDLRGQSRPWASWKVSFAVSLAQVVEGVVLRQRNRICELTDLLAQKEQALVQKDVLSREIDHRVKNSLQIVSAFLQMQERQTQDAASRRAFSETSARVMSIARVHDSLYQSENVEDVDLGMTIEGLCRDLSELAGTGQTVGITAYTRVMVPYRKAVALSLIATELVTNAFKYATTEAGAAKVEVSIMDEGGGSVLMRVCDDGVGLPEGWAERKPRGTGLGMKLVRAMLDQIDATLEVANAPGACFTIHA